MIEWVVKDRYYMESLCGQFRVCRSGPPGKIIYTAGEACESENPYADVGWRILMCSEDLAQAKAACEEALARRGDGEAA